MGKEHAGGPAPEGMSHIPIQWVEDSPQPIAIAPFPWEDLDSVEDRIKQAQADGTPLIRVVADLAREAVAMERHEIVNKLIRLIIDHRKPGLAAHMIAIAAGLYVTADIDQVRLGRKYGVSKQAVEQGVERYRVELGLRKTRTMRDEAARANMRASNHRQRKKQ